MNQNEIIKLLIYTGEYYGRTLSDGAISMMANQLSEFGLEAVKSALNKYTLNPKNRSFPMPAQLIAIIKPEIETRSIEDEASMLANKIWGAISKYGYSNPEQAQNYLGTVGWEAVTLQGGWISICQNSDPSKQGMWVAQMRDLISSISKKPIEKTIAIENQTNFVTSKIGEIMTQKQNMKGTDESNI